MRVESETYRIDLFRSRYDDLRAPGSYRSGTKQAARFEQVLQSSEAPTTDKPSGNDTIRIQIDVLSLPASVGRIQEPASTSGRAVTPQAPGEASGPRQATRNHAETRSSVVRPDSAPAEALAEAATPAGRSGVGSAHNRGGAAATSPASRMTADPGAAAPTANPVAKNLVYTPFGIYDPNLRAQRPVTDVAADSAAKAYFATHAPAEWKDDPEAVRRFTELYGAEAAGILRYFGTVPENIDPAWLSTPEQLARIDAEGNLLLSLQDYYHMTDEMAANSNLASLFPELATDLPFIPSSLPFLAPADLAEAAPALLANLSSAAPTAQSSTSALHRRSS